LIDTGSNLCYNIPATIYCGSILPDSLFPVGAGEGLFLCVDISTRLFLFRKTIPIAAKNAHFGGLNFELSYFWNAVKNSYQPQYGFLPQVGEDLTGAILRLQTCKNL